MSDPTEPAGPGVAGTVQTFLTFRPYPLQVGQKIFIDGGPRRGDWEVVGLSDRKVKLRCPFSGAGGGVGSFLLPGGGTPRPLAPSGLK